ncbi:MAG: polysaccharide pyruvyl transferase family protein [Clostridia bacterium]|nr:polysaccharide pyruvyl transferase family protein [Clostridia bacterium]
MNGKKKIGLMTFLHNENYGSILQAWALQRTLTDLGMDARHLDYAPDKAEKVRNLLLSGNSPRLILEGMRKRSATSRMRGGFDEFRAAHLLTGTPCRNRAELRREAAGYDVLVCGSDQIWSPVWLNPAYFLDFADGPKVSYAPSLGVSALPERRKQRMMARLIKRFSAVSVREEEGAALLCSIAGVDAPVMPDPVMLPGRDAWLRLCEGVETTQEPYILCYFIGDSPAYWQRVREEAARLGCNVLVIPRTEGARSAGHPMAEDVPPEKWVALIANTTLLITDSFHGAAFSAILNRRCVILRRYCEDDPESKNSRIDQLLRHLGVSRLEDPDWAQINMRLAQLSERGKKWLLDAISQAAQ